MTDTDAGPHEEACRVRGARGIGADPRSSSDRVWGFVGGSDRGRGGCGWLLRAPRAVLAAVARRRRARGGAGAEQLGSGRHAEPSPDARDVVLGRARRDEDRRCRSPRRSCPRARVAPPRARCALSRAVVAGRRSEASPSCRGSPAGASGRRVLLGMQAPREREQLQRVPVLGGPGRRRVPPAGPRPTGTRLPTSSRTARSTASTSTSPASAAAPDPSGLGEPARHATRRGVVGQRGRRARANASWSSAQDRRLDLRPVQVGRPGHRPAGAFEHRPRRCDGLRDEVRLLQAGRRDRELGEGGQADEVDRHAGDRLARVAPRAHEARRGRRCGARCPIRTAWASTSSRSPSGRCERLGRPQECSRACGAIRPERDEREGESQPAPERRSALRTASSADRSTSAAMPSSPALSATWAARTAGTSGSGMVLAGLAQDARCLEQHRQPAVGRAVERERRCRRPSARRRPATRSDTRRRARRRGSPGPARRRRAPPGRRRRAARRRTSSASVSPTYASAPRRSIPFRRPDGRRDVHHPGQVGVLGAGEQAVDEALGRPDVARRPRGLGPPAGERGRRRRPPRWTRRSGAMRRRARSGSASSAWTLQRFGDPRVAEAVQGEVEGRLAEGEAGRLARRRPARAASATARAPACSAGS